MQARKMQQTKNAMKTIIGEMRDQDFITILRYFFLLLNVTIDRVKKGT